MNILEKEIPEIKFPNIGTYEIKGIDEPIISLSEAGFIVSSEYYSKGVPGSYADCYARKTVVDMLKKAESLLPDGLKFKIYDAYRPICVQQRLWNLYRRNLKIKYPNLSNNELDYKTSFFISKPSYNINIPSLHNTGGAIDLTIVAADGNEINMGTKFDDFSNRAWTNHFEDYEDNEEVKINRRILYNAMINAGFTNLPSEWWHYDYGDKFWAYFTNNTALYKGIIDIPFSNRFPLR